MNDTTPPRPVDDLLKATNAGDMEAFLDAFTADGVVDDWGRRFTGREEIRGWSSRESIGVNQTFAVDEFTVDGNTVVVHLQVGGGGFNGPSTFVFSIDGDKVGQLKISP